MLPDLLPLILGARFPVSLALFVLVFEKVFVPALCFLAVVSAWVIALPVLLALADRLASWVRGEGN